MTDDSPWLDDRQQRMWRGWIGLGTRLPAALHRQLQADSGLSLQDFEVLVRLSETPDDRLRVTDLAEAAGWERSRLSHHVTRMERRGLVQRQECCEDARGAFVVLTPAGADAIRRAAPGHARSVRELVFGSMSEEDLDVVTRFVESVSARLDGGAGAKG